MLKSSQFNFWSSLTSNDHLLFNGISGALYQLNSEEKSLALNLIDDPDQKLKIDQEILYKSLLEGGFIIPENINEVECLVHSNKQECSAHKILDLVICPTYGCNFRCKYCYVDFKAQKMSIDTEKRILKYVEQILPQYQQFNLSWFGGEPLLCLETVLKLSKQFNKLVNLANVKFYNFITTNCYLLNLENAHKLYEVGIRFFHITIDGASQYHDKLRVLANGQPSYSTLIKNLQNILINFSDVHLTLRMNVSEENIESCTEVLDTIPAEFRKRVQVNITPILYEDRTPSLYLYKKINEVTRYAIKNGYLHYDTKIPVGRCTFCAADKLNNFQIGSDGTLYKCSPADNKPEVKVGKLDDKGNPKFNENYTNWHQKSPIIGEKCANCPYLCFCAGGCRLERLRDTQEMTCQNKYQDLENLIINRYLAINNNALS